MPELLHGQEREVFGDQAYWKEGLGSALPDQSASYRQAAVERALADDQPGPLANSRPWRALLSEWSSNCGASPQ
jgi:hypothetical protein